MALARSAISPRSLRARWHDRQANRGRPLLLVSPSDDADGHVTVVGPAEEGEPRSVEPSALATNIVKVAGEPPLRASRVLEGAIASLSAQVLPGGVVRGLLTEHYVRTCLPAHKFELRDQLAKAGDPRSRTATGARC